MEAKREEIRKGPWKAEEDEVLINHVKKYGPRDWSSIRSKGLLQRTGKSCRLRWVNKLRPNLKKTDNDVKNFWSSRQKRLARILQNSNPPSSSSSSISKSHKMNGEVPGFEIENFPSQVQKYCSSMEDKSSQSCSLSSIDNNYDIIKMVPLPDLVNSKLLHFDTTNYAHIEELDQRENYDNNNNNQCTSESQLQISFSHVLPQPQQDMTFSPGSQELLARFEDPYFFDVFGPVDDAPELAVVEQPFLKPATGCCCDGGRDGSENPDAFFDDFPADMFDQIESLPSPSDW
ncbi:hypothetical protein JRO89_XS01G0021800 [Xanthoceras sorbifolium]|uniref:Uncharacterized protein n=1 Tax=Xanthoceras sorbifolium TaxID=99658 RepID=A0ABQ8IHW5_9ROSI|nr:hypothetical protein JRO89_XS01G0021800 [Xanthoceras sorbifolium]